MIARLVHSPMRYRPWMRSATRMLHDSSSKKISQPAPAGAPLGGAGSVRSAGHALLIVARCRSRKIHPCGFARWGRIRASFDAMLAILHLLGTVITNLFKSRRRLEAENLFLRHQLNIALRRAPHRPRLRGSDRAVMVWLTWLWPSLTRVARVVEPDTILRWHRAGFRAYWRWKSAVSREGPPTPRVAHRPASVPVN
jgi:hypothetical protein